MCGTPAAVRAVSQAALWAQTSAGASFTPKAHLSPLKTCSRLIMMRKAEDCEIRIDGVAIIAVNMMAGNALHGILVDGLSPLLTGVRCGAGVAFSW